MRSLLLTLALGALGAGCADNNSEDEVRTRVDPTADFTSFHTFAFTANASNPDPAALGANASNPDASAPAVPSTVTGGLAVVNNAVRSELLDKGLTEVNPDQNPDLFVGSLASTEDQQALTWSCVPGYWWGYGWGYAWDPCAWLDPLYVDYTVGTVAIGLVHVATQSVPFGGVMQGVLDNSGNATDRVNDDVNRMFKDYPANQTGTGN